MVQYSHAISAAAERMAGEFLLFFFFSLISLFVLPSLAESN